MLALRIALSFVLLVLVAPIASAQDLTFRGCTDGAGRAVPSRLDEESPVLVTTVVDKGRFTIIYNPRALPGVSDAVRAFLYAHECARHNLGSVRELRNVENAGAADCWGLTTLQRSGLLRKPGDVAKLQSELAFTASQWQRIPGPVRDFELAQCPQRATQRAPSNPGWNRCVHACGDRLFRCGQSNSCMQTYNRCESACRK